MARRMRSDGGTPIEEAPVWVLAILVVLLWLIIFPALVGLLDGLRLVQGGGYGVAAAAAAISLLLVVGLARQKPWKRPAESEPPVDAPVFVRFATWLYTALIFPNVLFGALVLFRGGEGLGYLGAWAIGGIVSLIHGAFALAERWRRGRG